MSADDFGQYLKDSIKDFQIDKEHDAKLKDDPYLNSESFVAERIGHLTELY